MKQTVVAAAAVLGALGCSSCISRGTFVRTPRGLRKIEELVVGDALFSLDPLTGKTVETVLVAVRSAMRECVQLEIPGATLIATSDHPLYDPDVATWAPAGDWVLGKRAALMRFDGERAEAMKVRAVSSYAGLHQVFDLTVESDLHNFIANDVLVHNKSPIEPTCQNPAGETVQAFSACDCVTGVGTGIVSCGGGPNDSYACLDCTFVDEDGGTQDAGAGERDAGPPDSGFLTGPLAFDVQMLRSVIAFSADGGVELAQAVLLSSTLAFCEAGATITQESAGVNIAVGRSSEDGGRFVSTGSYPTTQTSPSSPMGGASVSRADLLVDGGSRVYSNNGPGTVNLTYVGLNGMAGTFDVVLDLNDGGTSPLSGSFNAPPCP